MGRGCKQTLSKEDIRPKDTWKDVQHHYYENANQNLIYEIPPHNLLQWLSLETKKKNAREVLRKGNPHTLLVGMCLGAPSIENSMEVP